MSFSDFVEPIGWGDGQKIGAECFGSNLVYAFQEGEG